MPSIASKAAQSSEPSLCEATTRCAFAYVPGSSRPIIEDSDLSLAQLVSMDQRRLSAALGSVGP